MRNISQHEIYEIVSKRRNRRDSARQSNPTTPKLIPGVGDGRLECFQNVRTAATAGDSVQASVCTSSGHSDGGSLQSVCNMSLRTASCRLQPW
jgi:hypothetical protein